MRYFWEASCRRHTDNVGMTGPSRPWPYPVLLRTEDPDSSPGCESPLFNPEQVASLSPACFPLCHRGMPPFSPQLRKL